MSDVLVLQGSPRRDGNTSLLAEAFADGARLHNAVETLAVCDARVHPCIGCNACYSREGRTCFRRDGMDAIYEKMRRVDVLVLASPVYFYGVSAQLKTVIDRFHAPVRDTFPLKRLGLILVGAATLPGLFDSILVQYRSALDFFHLESVGTVLARGCKDKGDVKSAGFLAAAYDMGAQIR